VLVALWSVVEPLTRKAPAYKFVPVAEWENKAWKVEEPKARKLVAKRLVAVAEVEKSFWIVEEAKMVRLLANRLVAVAEPEISKPETVVEARVDEPLARKLAAKRFVAVAEVEKSLWMVEEARTVRLLAYKLLEVAEPVTRSPEAVVEARVEEAVERKPLRNAKAVEVACSPEESVRNG